MNMIAPSAMDTLKWAECEEVTVSMIGKSFKSRENEEVSVNSKASKSRGPIEKAEIYILTPPEALCRLAGYPSLRIDRGKAKDPESLLLGCSHNGD